MKAYAWGMLLGCATTHCTWQWHMTDGWEWMVPSLLLGLISVAGLIFETLGDPPPTFSETEYDALYGGK